MRATREIKWLRCLTSLARGESRAKLKISSSEERHRREVKENRQESGDRSSDMKDQRRGWCKKGTGGRKKSRMREREWGISLIRGYHCQVIRMERDPFTFFLPDLFSMLLRFASHTLLSLSLSLRFLRFACNPRYVPSQCFALSLSLSLAVPFPLSVELNQPIPSSDLSSLQTASPAALLAP